MTRQEMQDLEVALRAEHHSEWRWTHGAAQQLLKVVNEQQERIAKLEAVIHKLIRHQPHPCRPEVERDFNEAGLLVPERF